MRFFNIFYKWILKKKQEKIDGEFYLNGLTDEILDEQVELNIKRNKFDVVDFVNLNDDGYNQ